MEPSAHTSDPATPDTQTPAALGFTMPAEWDLHDGCLMAWPARPELWGSLLETAKTEYAAVAHAIARFEPVTMICNPGQESEVADACGSEMEVLPIPIDDSWARDSGPIFVRDASGDLAVVDFGFNAWGERWHPFDHDDALPRAIASHLGLRRFVAPMVLEGGAFTVDGEGTLLTTEQCLLHPNRNPNLGPSDMEETLRDYLGVTDIVWLGKGHSLDTGPAGTDGHVDGIVHYVGPGHVLLEVPGEATPEARRSALDNRERLAAARDAAGRSFEISTLDPGPDLTACYVNSYLANGAVVVPLGGHDRDPAALEELAEIFPDREVVGVPAAAIGEGGGGVHCITQQIPHGLPRTGPSTVSP